MKPDPFSVTVCLLGCLVINATAFSSANAGTPAAGAGAGDPAARREALQQKAAEGLVAIPALVAALEDDHAVVRRTAVRLLADLGKPAHQQLVAALNNSDFIVRRVALDAALRQGGDDVPALLEKALGDEHPLVRQMAASTLVGVKPRTREILALLEVASRDRDESVRNIAADALWPFHKDVLLLRNRKDWDHEVTVTQRIPLPKEGWKFRTDPKRNGHLTPGSEWFAPDLEDDDWLPIQIEQTWESQYEDYDGVAWYRITIELPAKPDHNAVELHFGAVDESTWVWVNGQYAGQHDIGPDGWDKPFAIDITSELQWGGPNQFTIRVLDTKFAGGIYKPVWIEVLK